MQGILWVLKIFLKKTQKILDSDSRLMYSTLDFGVSYHTM